MKRCPFCAEEIQDAAIVCRFCSRDLPAAAPLPAPPAVSPRLDKTTRLGGLVIVTLAAGALLFSMMMASPGTGPAGTPSKVLLQMSAGRGGGGFSLTNREAVPVTLCFVTVLDQGNDDWIARIEGPLAPSETTRVEWERFVDRDQPMPSYVGLNRKYFTVSCDVNGVRRSAGVAF